MLKGNNIVQHIDTAEVDRIRHLTIQQYLDKAGHLSSPLPNEETEC